MAGRRPSLTALVLAAGKGTRLRSNTIKLLHPVAGRPMVTYVVEAAQALKPKAVISVVGYQADRVRDALEPTGSSFVLQKEQLGTGHAVLQAAARIRAASASTLLILNGDVPTLRPSTLRKLVARHRRTGAALTLLTADLEDPTGYGRIVRGAHGPVERIVEQKDASADEKAIREVNIGFYCADSAKLLRALRKLRPDNSQGEYYITDAVRMFIAGGERVEAVRHGDAPELMGVNTRQELAAASRTLYERKADELQDRGVTLFDASRTMIDPRARIGRDTVIYPDVVIEGPTVIGSDCVVRPGCRIVTSRLGKGVEVKDHSVVLDARIGNDVQVGPFAHLRPDSVLEDGSRVGNFVELKKTRLGKGSKASHLSYLGDSTIGANCNIGAGTITCNYDGTHKHPTTLGKGVFIGSNSALVAPIEIGDGAYVAAGSTATQDIPGGALAVARGRQRNIEGWTKRKKKPRRKH